jgi:3-oxoacid CoA-transferase A subunit
MNVICSSVDAAVSDIFNGATVLLGGFGFVGVPFGLLDALYRHGARDLIIVNTQFSPELTPLFTAGRVRRFITSFPGASRAELNIAQKQILNGDVELELVPQGTLAERLRAAGAGVPAFYTSVGVGTEVCGGKEVRRFDNRDCVLERALRGDFALVRAHRGDRFGNLSYLGVARNFNGVMATAAAVTIAEVDEVVTSGSLDPYEVVTPSVYVDRVVATTFPEPPSWAVELRAKLLKPVSH